MKKSNKKGFTIVELVIVIAVIAILAAVLIPTFSSLTKRANLSSDKQAVREMNMALAADEALHGKPTDIETVMKVLANAGYNSDNWVCLTAGYEVYWFKEDNRLVLYNAAEAAVEYPTEYDAKIMTDAKNHFFLYNENNQTAIKMDIGLGNSTGSSNYNKLTNGKGQNLDSLVSSATASEQTSLQVAKNAIAKNEGLKSNLGIDGTTYIYAAREIKSSAAPTYASMQVISAGGKEDPKDNLKRNGDIKENLFVIRVNKATGASAEEIATAQKEAGKFVYTVFAKITAGQITGSASIVLEGGATIDVSSNEWQPVKEFTGYFGSSDPQKPVVIDGARLTDATGYASTVGFTGSSSKYFVTGFFGTVYGTTTIENVTFRNLTFTEPATDYTLTQADKDNGKINSRNCIGIIGGITNKGDTANTANVTLRNIVVEDSVSMLAGATAGGLVGYVGASVDGQTLAGTVLIDNCKISAKISSNYQTAESAAYGPLGGIVGLMCRSKDTTVTIKDSTFNGSIDGYYGIGAAVGDAMYGTLKFKGTVNLADAKLNAAGHAAAYRVGYVYCANSTKAVIDGATINFKSGEAPVASCDGNDNLRNLDLSKYTK